MKRKKTRRELYAAVTYLDSDKYVAVLDARFNEFLTTENHLLEIATSDGCSLLCVFSGPISAIDIQKDRDSTAS